MIKLSRCCIRRHGGGQWRIKNLVEPKTARARSHPPALGRSHSKARWRAEPALEVEPGLVLLVTVAGLSAASREDNGEVSSWLT